MRQSPVEKTDQYCFKAITLRNRLGMPIEIDICPVTLEDHFILVVQANMHYHRSVIKKNIEQVALQLRQRYVKKGDEFSIVEYSTRHQHKEGKAQWLDWRVKWAEGKPIDAKSHVLPDYKIQQLITALQNASQPHSRAT